MNTFNNGDTIEMKAIKHAEFASEETHCFEGNIYLNGKLFCRVSNDGRGGPNNYDRNVGELDSRISEEFPQHFLDFDKSWIKSNLEIWCNDQVERWLMKKDFNKAMRKGVLVIDPKDPKSIQVVSFKGKPTITARHIEFVSQKYSDHKILNAMKATEAFELYAELA